MDDISWRLNDFREKNNIETQNTDHDDIESTNELNEFFENFSSDTGFFLLYLNLFIFFLSSFLSYFLAWKTLVPIKLKMEEQDQFIADVSHELRNPLWAILVSCESLLRDSKLTLIDSREGFYDISVETKRLIDISEWLIEIIKNTWNTTPDSHEINIFELIWEIEAILWLEIENKKISFQNDIETDYFMIWNRQDFMRVFYNLIQNAIKFSKDGGIVEIANDAHECISITDYGIGISKKEISNIFRRFYKIDGARSFESKWSGLWLSIVKETLLKYKYNIRVESTQWKWTTFTIYN